MKGWTAHCVSRVALAFVAIALTVGGCASSPEDSRWITLMDGGRGLENFNRVGNANWRAEDGAIVADRGNGFLVTKESYGDFQVRAEFWADEDANSGILIRMQNPASPEPTNSYEANIFDKRPDPAYGTGAIVNFATVSPMPKAANKWNVMEIIANGPRLIVVFNGQRTVDIQDSSFARGPFSLQSAGGTIKWRKVQVRPL